MKCITPKAHVAIDYLSVVIFTLAPTVLDMETFAMYLSYTLASVHFLVTILTDMPYSLFKVIPYNIHGVIELIVGPSLIILSLSCKEQLNDNYLFFTFVGIFLIMLWALTHYKEEK